MTSKHRSHEECVQPTRRAASAGSPKLLVQRSPSKDTVTIRFSALGKEEEEEEEELELYSTGVSPTPASQDESNIVTAVEACEEMFQEETLRSEAEDAVTPQSSGRHHSSSPTQTLPSHIVEQKAPTASPTKSLSFSSSDRGFPGVGKSLSSDLAPPAAAPTTRHRQLMKTLAKSLSSDTSQDSSSILATPYRLPEARLNLQLFKQFTQSRTPPVSISSAGDSKTAPCSPLTSPDRGGFFKVSEVEARFEDTKRRLSEAISEPLQLLSKIMDEKSGSSAGGHRPKALSASATELSSMAHANGQAESNNYCIKEEEGAEWEKEGSAEPPASLLADTRSPSRPPSHSVSLDKCSMSALARQEDEDFCILYSDDFENGVEAEAAGGDGSDEGAPGRATKVPLSAGAEAGREDEADCVEPGVPLSTLTALTLVVYGYFVLPLPSYVGGLLLGAGLGFLLAIGVVWLTGLQPSHCGFRHSRDSSKLWNLSKLDIREPEMYKVSKCLLPLAEVRMLHGRRGKRDEADVNNHREN